MHKIPYMRLVLNIDSEDINQSIELAKLEGICISTMLDRVIRQHGYMYVKHYRTGKRVWVKDRIFWRAPSINHTSSGKVSKERRVEVAKMGGEAYREKVPKERKREIARLGGKATTEKMRSMKAYNYRIYRCQTTKKQSYSN